MGYCSSLNLGCQFKGWQSPKGASTRLQALHLGVHQVQSSLQEHHNFKGEKGSDAAQTISYGFCLRWVCFVSAGFVLSSHGPPEGLEE